MYPLKYKHSPFKFIFTKVDRCHPPIAFPFFWLSHKACGILVPRPGIEPVPLAVEAWSLNHWTTREVPAHCFPRLINLRFCSGIYSNYILVFRCEDLLQLAWSPDPQLPLSWPTFQMEVTPSHIRLCGMVSCTLALAQLSNHTEFCFLVRLHTQRWNVNIEYKVYYKNLSTIEDH